MRRVAISNKTGRTVVKQRLTRVIYRTVDPVRRRTVIVKRYDDWREAIAERDVMQKYGKNPHLVQLYGWHVKEGRGSIVMEYVRGRTVNELIKKRGALPPAKVVALLLNVLAGVEVLHRHRFVHGDLHGDNVIVTDYGKAAVKIIDMQHAVKVDEKGRARAKRKLKAPPPSLAPESRGKTIDRRYDIYGVGFIGASMLAGQVPKTSAQLKSMVRHDTPLWRVIHKALHPDPDRRYDSARAMIGALQAVHPS